MSKKIIGISAYYHDSAIAFIEAGEIIFASQEERFSSVKKDEPIVKTIEDPYSCFLNTDLDYLVCSNFVMRKKDQYIKYD